MNKLLYRIPFETASRTAIGVFGLFILFHLGALIAILGFGLELGDYLWGGKMETTERLIVFECISLAVQILFLWIVRLRYKLHLNGKYPSGLRLALWGMSVLFALNTFGNILAESGFERILSLVTILLCVLCIRLALPEPRTQ
jgi:hypothetical protein